MFIRLLYIFLILIVFQGFAKPSVNPVDFKNLSVFILQLNTSERTQENKSEEKGNSENEESDQEESEIKTSEEEGLVNIDLSKIYHLTTISKLYITNQSNLIFFKPELNTPPPEHY
jgi:hypothetical protein